MDINMFLIVINFFEIAAAIVGTIYITKYREDHFFRYFVYFLWFSAFVDTVFGWLPTLIHYTEQFSFLKGTIFSNNQWSYNVFDLINFSFYLLFFIHFIDSYKVKKTGVYILIGYITTSLLNLVFSGKFFEAPMIYNLISGTLLLILFIIIYYYRILQSERILDFYKMMPFYVSVGALVFHIIVNPVFIYGEYYNNDKSPEFVQVYRIILTAANIFMYTCYIIGFIVCSRRNKSY
ncbi:hypothetical protein ATO12_24950 [Aquimarina atlantica]|uniref:Histidine kinase N-terminal 7TM region domain-containing protein n=1 Tax=Aquimarina atlantica TaxID=1317122 RepID=A0A023BQ35_9FLAO|nr:hypothetical protein ATO12_24950 [Aquimarina atlantica]